MSHVLIVTGVPLDHKIYEALLRVKEMGHSLHLLSDGNFEPMQGLFETVFTCDLSKTKDTLEMLKTQPIHFDAVTLQFSDWLTPLVALIAREYGCIGNDPIVAFNCRSKYHMRKKLQTAGIPGPKFRLCRNFGELRKAVREIGFPCVAKPIGANGSYGVFALMSELDMAHLKSNYEASINFLKQRMNEGDIFNFTEEELKMIGVDDPVNMATDYLVEEYMMGPEISIDALVQDGKVTIMGIEEQIRMEPPYFIQLGAKLPFNCPSEQMKEIKTLVSNTIKAMGIRNSATHTEIIFTKDGPKIVEIGCRFGGDDLHDTILEVTGYSMMYESVMIALGVKRKYSVKTLCHTAMEYLLPTKAGVVQEIYIHPDLKNDPDVTEVFLYVKPGDSVSPPPACFDFLGYVATRGSSIEAAERKLKRAVNQIKITLTHD
ncbi:ATP-grasp domain-containing protein [Patescibacteria group bacterium]|nr:ATP-grasp domain-containing protein [Patescibacteria group bacterium]MBU1016162.1 ATP-grasp domain-containing protein [Patescibacteria group bacterium]MBU1684710.1 ATP-grasp domain-containing protein [Patescibacteria group bacterium]MBU1938895.1 ATP-grasp domain-containing protein [Patescibacteria group bacterium]